MGGFVFLVWTISIASIASRHFSDISLNQTYASGGAGYVLSRVSLEKLVNVGLLGPALCDTNEKINEDVEIGKCMRKLNVTVGDSRLLSGLIKTFWHLIHIFPYYYDRDLLGRHRFHPLSPNRTLLAPASDHWDNWVRNYSYFPYELVSFYSCQVWIPFFGCLFYKFYVTTS